MSPEELRQQAELIETFRKALMVEHSKDWDMDTVSEAAHICARSLAPAIRRALARDAAIEAEPEITMTFRGECSDAEAIGHNTLLRRLRAVGAE